MSQSELSKRLSAVSESSSSSSKVTSPANKESGGMTPGRIVKDQKNPTQSVENEKSLSPVSPMSPMSLDLNEDSQSVSMCVYIV